MKGPQQLYGLYQQELKVMILNNEHLCRHEKNLKPSTATFLVNLKFPQIESFI